MENITTPLAKEVFEVLCDYTSRPTPPILLKINKELALKVQALEEELSRFKVVGQLGDPNYCKNNNCFCQRQKHLGED